MELSKKDWNIEEERLEAVKKHIDERLHEAEGMRSGAFGQGIELSKDYWDNNVTVISDSYDLKSIVDITQNIQAVQKEKQKIEVLSGDIKKLKLLRDKLYFGRIDFKEKGEFDHESIYIGAATLLDDLDILVYDWRSPVSAMFYEYELGDAEYSCPDGIIQGEVSLKRQFNISDRKIRYMFDTDMTIDDDMLQKSLSDNCDENMKTIIKSIQKEQNRVIRNKNEDILIVQGPAGSGKTSIALHRAAYVLYKYKDRGLKSDNIMIFSPNAIFNDYISKVLPELGEEKICQSTFMEFAEDNIHKSMKMEDQYNQMEAILSNEDRRVKELKRDSIVFKGSLQFQRIIERYIRKLEKRHIYFKDVNFRQWHIMTGAEIHDLYTTTYSKWPIKHRYKEIIKDIKYRMKQMDIRKERFKELEEEFREKNAYCDVREESLGAILDREISGFENRLRRTLSINEKEVYEKLLKDDGLFREMARGIEVPSNVKELLKSSRRGLNEKKLLFEDITPMLYIKGALGGMELMRGIKYVIIDEAQDYTPFQYKLFRELFPKAGFTILGDINQSINPYSNTMDYGIVSDIFHGKKSNVIELQKSYRSTKEISDFTKRIIGNDTIINVSRDGEKPSLVKVTNENDRIDKILEGVQFMINDELSSIGIICRDEQTALDAYEELKKRTNIEINLMKKDDEKFLGGINVMPSYISKGLEFDGVIIFDGDDKVYSREEDRLLFYTICTRALHRLSIIYKDNHTRFIK